MLNELVTPCYIFDENGFVKNIELFKDVLRTFYGEKWIMGYSFKTNYLPYVLNSAKKNECYAEVVSEKEYLLAKRIGFESDKIIYNGPVKTKNTFMDAISNNCILNIDSHREIEWLKDLPLEKKSNVGLRVNFDVEKENSGETLMGNEGGRFGFCLENGELYEVIKKIKSYGNIDIRYLHMHISSKSKSVNIYRSLTKKACQIIKDASLNISYIDIGGGFFGGGDDGSSYRKYISAIKDEMTKYGLGEVGLIVEPGASLIASCMSYLTEVVDIKDTINNHFVVVDGSRLHIDPFFARNNYSHVLFSNYKDVCNEQTLVGFTCMEKDRLGKLIDERKLDLKDRILFENVGSYTMCMNSDFISSEPRVYAQCGEEYYLIRTEKDMESYFCNNILEIAK